VNEGLHLTQSTLDRFYEPELWRLKGELLLASSRQKGKTVRKMAELQYGNPIHFAKLGDALDLPTAFVKKVFEGHAEWRGKSTKRTAALISISGRRMRRVRESS
jgi:hypothetical protein